MKAYTSILVVAALGCLLTASAEEDMSENKNAVEMEKATFGSGCFWCTEAVFETVKGVKDVVSGYTGGQVENPSYKQVCSGQTGHAEAVEITFDPSQVSYRQLLALFWKSHDPTTEDRQGADVGSQYRSAIFYHSDEQKKEAEQLKRDLNERKTFGRPVVTEISPAATFYVAEDYHQDYFRNNPNAPYCAFNIAPKLKKLKKAEVEGDR
jgi:peptide-methionine (S)-S-oxide reductase